VRAAAILPGMPEVSPPRPEDLRSSRAVPLEPHPGEPPADPGGEEARVWRAGLLRWWMSVHGVSGARLAPAVGLNRSALQDLVTTGRLRPGGSTIAGLATDRAHRLLAVLNVIEERPMTGSEWAAFFRVPPETAERWSRYLPGPLREPVLGSLERVTRTGLLPLPCQAVYVAGEAGEPQLVRTAGGEVGVTATADAPAGALLLGRVLRLEFTS